jgi:hypothetical protein
MRSSDLRPSRIRPAVGVRGIVFFVSEQLDLTIVYEPPEEGRILATIAGGVFSQG